MWSYGRFVTAVSLISALLMPSDAMTQAVPLSKDKANLGPTLGRFLRDDATAQDVIKALDDRARLDDTVSGLRGRKQPYPTIATPPVVPTSPQATIKRTVEGAPYVEQVNREQDRLGFCGFDPDGKRRPCRPEDKGSHPLTQKALQKCDPLAIELVRNEPFPNFPRTPLPASEILQRATSIAQFDEACLSKDKELPPSLRVGILQAVGLLLYEGNPKCTATRIRSRILLTARHCLSDLATDVKYSEADIQQYLRFVSLTSPKKELRINRELPNSYYVTRNAIARSDDRYDFVFLETADEVVPFIPLVVGLPDSMDRVVVFGLHRLIVQARFFLKGAIGKELDHGDMIDAFRWDDGPACKIQKVEGGCIYYGCQTENGVSGAPVFSRDAAGGALRIVGIHIKSASDPGFCRESSGLGNVGIVVPDGDIAALVH